MPNPLPQPKPTGPFVPWPHIETDARPPTAHNPAREQRGAADHQADGQEEFAQAR